ncbi:unnamed protein product [Brachionus calyciflorus]|uniref:Uncharacterized protein n=1 Tax=Brachionus calyciflorus TaxID=104777 RepID=A0A814E378_9BILA|nr:unnamed protein product [Brachionus calyciflorus]
MNREVIINASIVSNYIVKLPRETLVNLNVIRPNNSLQQSQIQNVNSTESHQPTRRTRPNHITNSKPTRSIRPNHITNSKPTRSIRPNHISNSELAASQTDNQTARQIFFQRRISPERNNFHDDTRGLFNL